ncbi:MAG: FAD-dependent oxidoreductase, partial [Chthoniobacterales bacterium]
RCFATAGELPMPDWAPSLGARRLEHGELLASFTSGFTVVVPLIDTSRYLDYLAARFRAAGGSIVSNILFSAGDFEKHKQLRCDVDCIINCSGIGAQRLVPDPDLEPHRGQIAIVEKLALGYAVVCDDSPFMYAFPRSGDCVFGGTNTISDERAPDPADTERIVAECSRVLNIDRPRVLAERVGLRPFRRSGVRIEAELLGDGRTLIHNYGHGGSGFTLSWGCAEEVFDLARTPLR